MEMGIMVRDCNGEALACLNTSRNLNSQPILVECNALWGAIKFAEEIGLPNAQFEGDA